MGLFSGFTSGNIIHLGNDVSGRLRTLAHETSHVIQQRNGPIKTVADDVGKVGSKVSDGTADGLEGVGVPDGIAEGVGIGAEVAADGAAA